MNKKLLAFLLVLHLTYISAESNVTRPALFFNGTGIPDNTMVTIDNEQEVLVTCTVEGDNRIVSEVRIVCGSAKRYTGISRESVTVYVQVDIDMHLTSCNCRIMFNEGTHKTTSLTVRYRCAPRLVSNREQFKNHTVNIGQRLYFTFNIYANPAPILRNLTKNGTEVNPSEYKIAFKPGPQPIYYIVLFTMRKFDMFLYGTYNMSIDNELGDTLDLYFVVQEKEINGRSRNFANLIPLAGIATSIFAIGLFVPFLFVFMKEDYKDGEEGHDGDKAHSSETSDQSDHTEHDIHQEDDEDHLLAIGSNKDSVKKEMSSGFEGFIEKSKSASSGHQGPVESRKYRDFADSTCTGMSDREGSEIHNRSTTQRVAKQPGCIPF